MLFRAWSAGARSSRRLRLSGGSDDVEDAASDEPIVDDATVLNGFVGGEEGNELQGGGMRKSIRGSGGVYDVDSEVEGRGLARLPCGSESDIARRSPEEA